ncbi:MAG TPA: alkaline phosphatase family protein [Myxococcota bacterium]|nr:alkaline phosphatase family protein [Myxococcota bacterium]
MRLRSALAAASLAAIPGALLGVVLRASNPWFLDEPVTWFCLALLAPACLGAVFGLFVRTWSRPWVPAIPIALFLGSVLLPPPGPGPTRLLVVGVDGATFDRIDEMDLPAFSRLAAEGSRGTLSSMEPMFSPLLWTTIASGKPPRDHGIHGFDVHADDALVPRFWDIAESQGLRIGVYKWLVTYPPREVDGFVVPAWLAPSPETHPPELSFVKELELGHRMKRRRIETRPSWRLALAGIPHGLRLSTLREVAAWKLRERLEHPDDDERFVALNLLRGRIDRDVFVHALSAHEPEVATITYYATDGLGHRFWDQLGEDEDPLSDAYKQADELLGELLDRVGDDCAVVVLSDHGFKALDADKRFVQPKTERLRERLSAVLGEVQVSRLGAKLTVSAEDLGALQAELGTLVDDDGEPFYSWEVIDEQTLGVSLVDETEAALSGSVGGEPAGAYLSLTDRSYTGDHDARGIIYIRAPSVAPGGTIEGADLLDVAPTLLQLLDIRPAQDLPGRALVGEDIRGPWSRDDLVDDLSWPEAGEGVDQAMLEALGYIER